MTGDRFVAEALERATPPSDRIELDWQDVLDRAAALATAGAGNGRPPRRNLPRALTGRPGPHGFALSWRLLAVAGVAAALVVVVAVVAPWRGHGGGIVAKALAAVSGDSVLHAVVESRQPQVSILDLASGRAKPAIQRFEYWYDPQRRRLRLSFTLPGTPKLDIVVPAGPARNGNPAISSHLPQKAPPYPVALDAFAAGYQAALASGAAHETGQGRFAKRPVVWLSLTVGKTKVRVGVDRTSGKPVVIEPLQSDGRPGSPVWRVRTIETIPYTRAEFSAPRSGRSGGGQVTPQAAIPVARASTVSGWNPVWLGASFGGLRLVSTQPLKLTQVHGFRDQESTGLLLSYAGGANRILIEEARRPGLVGGFFSDEALPAAGHAVITTFVSLGGGASGSQCSAQLKTHGVWVTITAGGGEACTSAARALVPVGDSPAHMPSAPIRSPFPAPTPHAPTAPGPTPARCVEAWNRHAGAANLHTVAAARPLSARVEPASVDSISWSSAGRHTTSEDRGCAITFALGAGRVLIASGALKDGTIPSWHLPPTPLRSNVPAGPGNALVSSSGMLRLRH